jgi:pyridoxine 4-dehydrogenase
MKFSLSVVLALSVTGAEAFTSQSQSRSVAAASLFPKSSRLSSASTKQENNQGGGDGESRRAFIQKVAVSVPAAVAATTAAVTGMGLPTSAVAAEGEVTTAAAAASATTTISVAPVGIEFPPLGLGAWAWGDSLFWGYNPKNDEELNKVFDYAVENSKSKTTLFDTAEVYGFGRSEQLIGDFSKKYDQSKIQVATKFAAVPFRTKPDDVVKACEKSVERLGGRPIDLYQIHFPGAWSNAEYWDGLATAYDKGLVKAVGVSNYGVDAVRACHAALAKRGIPLASNQIQMSLLYRYPLDNGLCQVCEDLGVKVLSYSPLALGMLTGKYTLDAPPGGPRKAVFKALKQTPDYDNLLATMKDVANGHGDASLSQVALNWGRAKNSIPIPGARTLSQVKQNYGALDWNMSEAEVRALDLSAAKVTTFTKPESVPFPKEDRNTHLHMFDS